MHVQSIIDKTTEYLSYPAVVGYEQFFMNHLIHDFEELGLTVEHHKGLIAIHGDAPLSHIITAHLDRHGLISIGNGEYFYAAQYMKEIKYGDSNVGAQKILQRVADRFEGEPVYAYDAHNGQPIAHGVIATHSPCADRGDGVFHIDGMDDVPLGTPIAYAKEPEQTYEYFSGQIDNTLSIGVVHELFANGFQGTALLTTEEEIGKSWLHMSRYFEDRDINTDRLYVLDTSPYRQANLDIVKKGTLVLRNRDKSGVFNGDMVRRLIQTCEQLDVPYHLKDEFLTKQGHSVDELGSTELGKLILRNEARWNGATIQIPTTMYHTSRETTSMNAIETYYHVLRHLLIGVNGG